MEYVKQKQFMSYAKRIERQRMRANGSSLTVGSIARAANSYIIEMRDDLLIIKEGWRDAMKSA